jgi:hypothetical protein
MLDDRRAAERGFRLHEHCRDDLPSAIGACPRPNPAFGFDLGLASAPENPPATLISADPEGGAQDVRRLSTGQDAPWKNSGVNDGPGESGTGSAFTLVLFFDA